MCVYRGLLSLLNSYIPHVVLAAFGETGYPSQYKLRCQHTNSP